MATATSLPTPGQHPDLDAQTQVPVLVGIAIGFATGSTIAVALRLYTRYFIVLSFGLDDALILVSQILSIGVSVVTILEAKYALGVHVWMTTQEQIVTQLKALFAGIIIYNLAQIITKTSFLLQYRRIFVESRTRTVCLWFIIILAIWGVTQEVLLGLACVPLALIIPSHQGRCLDVLTIWYLTSSMNIVTDFMVFTTPMPAIRKLKLPWKQKVLVASIFGLGFFTCIISIVRVFTLRKAIKTNDPTWDNAPAAYWTVVELNCGILCACLPTLRPLLRRFFPAFFHQPDSAKAHLEGGSSGGITSKMSERRRVRDLYTLTSAPRGDEGGDAGIGSGASQGAPRGTTGVYDAMYYMRPPVMAELTTAISGGRAQGEEVDLEAAEAGRVGEAGPASPPRIRVTTRFGIHETKSEGQSRT